MSYKCQILLVKNYLMECSVSTSGSSDWLRGCMDKGTVLQHRATVLPNVGIIYVLGIIFVRVIKRILPRNRGGWAG